MLKTCTLCEDEKPLDDFYSTTVGGKKYQRSQCKMCTLFKQTSAKFGMTVEQLISLYFKQNHRCAICKQKCATYENLSVDHDHKCCPEKGKSCGKCVRGLLCANCNHGLGSFGDDVERLKAAIEYLGCEM